MAEIPQVAVVDTMDDDEIELSMPAQAGKLVISNLVGFAASHLAGKAFDAAVLARRARKIAKQS